MTDSMELFLYFILALVSVAFIGFMIFFKGSNAAFKRLYFPSFVIVCAGLLAMCILWIFPTTRFFVMFPIGMLGYACVQATKFCDRCGSTAAPNRRLRPRANCPKCGAPLK